MSGWIRACFFFSSRRRHTRWPRDWSSDVCSSDLHTQPLDQAELPVPVAGTCPVCGAGLVARQGPYGRYIHCERRPECKFTKPYTVGIPCPQCGQGELCEKRSRK